jgi:hypothetical protein
MYGVSETTIKVSILYLPTFILLWFCRLSMVLYCSLPWYNVVWFFVLLQCSFSSYWMIWVSTLHIRNHGHSGYFDFIILFVGILPLYAINLDVVSLFAGSSFLFLAMLNFYLYMMYSINYCNEWILLVKKIVQKQNIRLIYLYFTIIVKRLA